MTLLTVNDELAFLGLQQLTGFKNLSDVKLIENLLINFNLNLDI